MVEPIVNFEDMDIERRVLDCGPANYLCDLVDESRVISTVALQTKTY